MTDSQIKIAYELLDNIRRTHQLGKRPLTQTQVQNAEDVMQDLLVGWCHKIFSSNLEFKKMLYYCLWRDLQESNNSYRKYYSRACFSEELEDGINEILGRYGLTDYDLRKKSNSNDD